MISLDGHGGGCVRTLLSGLLRLYGIGVCAADFGRSIVETGMAVGAEQELLQRPGALRRRAHVDHRSRGRCSLAPCMAAATRQAATTLACDDVDVAWFLRLQPPKPVTLASPSPPDLTDLL